MKRLLLVASTLGLVLAISLTVGASPAPASADASHVHGVPVTALPTASVDDPVPVDCPFCGGNPQLHARRMNDIAVTSSRLAYSLLDAAIF